MPKCGVGLMVKYPVSGNIKTRLSIDIGNRATLAVYKKLVENIVSVLSSLDIERYHCTAFVDPPKYESKFSTNYIGLASYLSQQGNNLGARMLSSIRALLEDKQIGKAIIIGADIPEIDGKIIEQANEILETKDLVIGPVSDGGYYLIGMKKPTEELFENILWGSTKVFEQTVSIAKDLNLSTAIMRKLSDIDNLTDLKKFEQYYSIIN